MTNDKAADLFKALAKKQGFTDEQVTLALQQPEWKEIENRDNRHSEYSSALDKAKNLEPLAVKAKEWDTWWRDKGGSELYETHQEQAQRLARYQERFGDIDPSNPSDVRAAATVTGLTLQQAQAMIDQKLQEQGVRFSQMSNELLAVTVDAQQRGIKLTGDDVLAMNKIMAEKGVTYAGAYEQHLGPKVREMEQQRLENEKKSYAEQQLRDFKTRIGYTENQYGKGGTDGSPVASFFDRPKTGVAEKSMSDQELLSMWNDSAPGNNSRAA